MRTTSRIALLSSLFALAIACGDDSATDVPGAPVAVEPIVQPPAVEMVGATIELRMRVRDSAGTGVEGVNVEFTVLEGDGVLAPAGEQPGGETVITVTSDATGAVGVDWFLGTEEGSHTVRVRGLDVQGSSFSQRTFAVTAIP